jgi:hypothetical protein
MRTMKLNGMITCHITRGKFSEIILNSELHGGKSQMLEDVTGISAEYNGGYRGKSRCYKTRKSIPDLSHLLFQFVAFFDILSQLEFSIFICFDYV